MKSEYKRCKMTKESYYPKKNLIKGAIRRLFTRSQQVSDSRAAALDRHKKGVRGGKQYKCAICRKSFGLNKINVDHIEAVIPYDKTINDLSYDELVERIFCDISNLQVLCKGCHDKKSKEERKLRKQYRDERNKTR